MSCNPCLFGARFVLKSLVSAIVFTMSVAVVSAQVGKGGISGRTIDENTGLGVFGVTVTVFGEGISVTSDLSGSYSISDAPVGPVTLVVLKDQFQPTTITDVVVFAGDVTALDIPMVSMGGDVIRMDAFTVSAEIVQSSDIGLMLTRQKAPAISDAISNDQFEKLGAGNAAEALSKVTGASVVDGKYVLIRGLGDRYSNTTMNGVSVPSADPDKRAVQMDQFPSGMIESVVTTKSFTPDQSGAFAGGSVNLKTRSFPESSFLSGSFSVGMNDSVRGESLLITKGRSRAAPDLPTSLPNRTQAELEAEFFGNFDLARELDAATKSFDPAGFFPDRKKGEFDLGASFAIGRRIEFGDEGLFGVTASFTRDRSTSHYSGGEEGRFAGTASQPVAKLLFSSDSNLLTTDFTRAPDGTPEVGVTSSTRSESTGGFVKLAVRPTINHEVSLDLIHNENTGDSVRRGVGEESGNYAGEVYEVYDLLRTERSVSSAQLAGKSFFPAANELTVEWRLSQSESNQDQPDYRTMAFIYDLDGELVNATGVQPNRYFRELKEEAVEGGLDLSMPWFVGDKEHRLKFGGMVSASDRNYDEQRFQYVRVPQSRDDLVAFPGQVGIIAETANSVTFGNTITRLLEPNRYAAEQNISAIYAMMDAQFSDRTRAIFGARYESTEIITNPAEIPGLNPKTGVVDDSNLLPALSLVFAQNKRMNWRAAYGRTIARPTYKELTDIRYEDVFTGDTYIGSADLELSVIDNFDVRWEWFPAKGETIAASAFYKDMSNPIEVLFQPSVGSIQPQNVDSGTVYGIEFEYRRSLQFLGDAFYRWSVGGNLTFIESEVAIPDSELALLRAEDPQASDKRELLGQSPYVFNADVNYSREESGTSATLSYNVVGERLDLVVFGPLPDVYEQPSPTLNFVLSQRLSTHWKLKFSAKNLLNSDKEKLISLPSEDLIYSRYQTGRSVSLSLSYLFE
jgi:TonB-dependent receptor